MNKEITALLITAASIGFFHTLFGPDHYLPFIMMSWARKWSSGKTALITFLCGIGHILSSVVLGFIGIAFGLAVGRLELLESMRGNVAAWLLIGFGLAYMVWGLRQGYKKRPHKHIHGHHLSDEHTHDHDHTNEHVHLHESSETKSITPWALFVIFVFGPCEPLIPILMYPAAKSSWTGLILVTTVFGIATIGTMMGIVMLSAKGISVVKFNRLGQYTHAISGATILLCGLAIQFLGL